MHALYYGTSKKVVVPYIMEWREYMRRHTSSGNYGNQQQRLQAQ
jgi:hypothetical protein